VSRTRKEVPDAVCAHQRTPQQTIRRRPPKLRRVPHSHSSYTPLHGFLTHSALPGGPSVSVSWLPRRRRTSGRYS
jgi:hypothetical protein